MKRDETPDPAAAGGPTFWELLEAVPDAMVVVSEEGRILRVNEETLRLFGYPREELEGCPLEVLLPERFRQKHSGHRQHYLQSPKRRPMGTGLELFGRRKDGTEFPAEISLAPMRSAEGRFVSAVVRDVSARKLAEAGWRESDARYRSVLDNMLEAVQVLSFDWRYLYLNDAAARNGRQPREEMLGKTVMERFPGFEKSEMFFALRRCMEERVASKAEFDFTYPDGSKGWFEFSIQPVVEGLFILSLDITARKRVEHDMRMLNADLERRVRERTAQLEEANRFSNAVIENIPNMVFVKDAERLAFVRFNRAGEALLGTPRDELIGKTDHDFFPAADADFFQAKDRETLRSRSPLEIAEEPLETKRGRRWLHTKKVPILGDDGAPRFLLGISEDITERKLAEEARARLAAIVDSSDDAIIGRNLDGLVISWNVGAERLFGYSAEEMKGQPLTVIFPPRRADEEARLLEVLRKGGRVDHYETHRRRRDGRDIDVSVSLSPILDASGKVKGISKIVRDISETKRAQEALARAKSAAEAANRELESFSYSVAHDLRAPLRSIDGFSQALLDDCLPQLDADGRKYLSFIRESAQQMAQLIDDLLSLSRVTRSEFRHQQVDLSALARATLERLERAQPGRRVEAVVQDGLVAQGDSRLLGVVLDNLLGNAWKFTGKRETPTIEFGATSKDGQLAYFVKDNGAGFDMAFGHKLFGVFQRLHAASEFEGTGVGLAIVHRVVGRHGGRVWGEGETNRGATFYFTLYETRERS